MERIRLHRVVTFAAATLLTVAPLAVIAQSGASDDDKKFVDAALKGGMSEVDLGKMAAKSGKSDDVRQFGQMMVDDHTKLGEKMKVVAGDIGVKPPTMQSAGGMATETKLKVLTGDSFDKSYISAMVKDHEDDLAAFKQEAMNGTSPEVKKAAKEGAMVVQKHLTMIRKIAAAHNVTASVSQKPSPVHSMKPSPSVLASAVGGR
jgi:putative membrane protein